MNYELHYKNEGSDVRRLQDFLIANHAAGISPDGMFGPNTRAALIQFQVKLGLAQTAFVDANTFEALASKGLVLLTPPIDGAKLGSDWPPRPNEPPRPDFNLTSSLFGEFKFRHTPTASNPEKIEILDGWENDNIVDLHIPQLDKCLFAGERHYARREVGMIRCHKHAAAAFQELFSRWEEAGLLDRILTCAGVFNARLKRGASNIKPVNLSNHAWGTAIDLNAWENPLGNIPVGVGARGAVRELVGIANGLGFFWGGHYGGRPDGMHFELAQIG